MVFTHLSDGRLRNTQLHPNHLNHLLLHPGTPGSRARGFVCLLVCLFICRVNHRFSLFGLSHWLFCGPPGGWETVTQKQSDLAAPTRESWQAVQVSRLLQGALKASKPASKMSRLCSRRPLAIVRNLADIRMWVASHLKVDGVSGNVPFGIRRLSGHRERIISSKPEASSKPCRFSSGLRRSSWVSRTLVV